MNVFVGRAPGRLDIMGGNADYTGGLVFQATIREGTWAAVALREDDAIVLHNPQMKERGWTETAVFHLADLTTAARVRELVNREEGTRWTAYAIGVIFALKLKFGEKIRLGADILIRSEVPLNKGVSSSAAIEVAVMKTAAKAWGIDLSAIELAEACQWAENVIAQAACGIMDQIAVILGEEECVLPIECQPCVVKPHVRLPNRLRCWAIDSGVRHAVSGLEYEAARAAAFMGYKLICDREGLPVTLDESREISRFVDPRWNGYLANLPPSEFRARYEQALPDLMTGGDYLSRASAHVDPFTVARPDHVYRIRANTRYAVEENARVRLFVELARGGTGFEEMGELMYQSHHAYTECGLGCAATDRLVELVRAMGSGNGLFGAKITGGGAGGTVAVLGLDGARDAFDRVVSQYAKEHGGEPYVFEGSSAGADRFGIHEFPVP
jgi:L-arabinokinase